MNGKPCAALDAALFSMFFFYELRKVQNFLQHFFGDFIVAFKQGEFQIVPADGRRCGGVCAEQVVCCNRQCIAQLSDGLGIRFILTGFPIADRVVLCADKICQLALRQAASLSAFFRFSPKNDIEITSMTE